jgi:hypothetical protein
MRVMSCGSQDNRIELRGWRHLHFLLPLCREVVADACFIKSPTSPTQTEAQKDFRSLFEMGVFHISGGTAFCRFCEKRAPKGQLQEVNSLLHSPTPRVCLLSDIGQSRKSPPPGISARTLPGEYSKTSLASLFCPATQRAANVGI